MDFDSISLVCQYLGSITGAYGAWKTTRSGPGSSYSRFIGFIGFTLSNIFIIAFLLFIQSWPLIAMQSFYLYTSLSGMRGNYKDWKSIP